ncbi:MAG: hypothetical protein HY515_04000 [Candidatus Aenigmarchaeota archaeon]|nr:hypothetical protein [Candidatus Aenigmarchaeota archaeon]
MPDLIGWFKRFLEKEPAELSKVPKQAGDITDTQVTRIPKTEGTPLTQNAARQTGEETANRGKMGNTLGEAYEDTVQKAFEDEGWQNIPEYTRAKVKTSHGQIEIDRAFTKGRETAIIEAKADIQAELKRRGLSNFKSYYGNKIAAVNEAFPNAKIVFVSTTEASPEIVQFFKSYGVGLKVVK